MNHLEEAKKNMNMFDANRHNSIDTMKAHAIAHALIAIAEQLEKMNEKYLKHDTLCTCYECTKHIKFTEEDK